MELEDKIALITGAGSGIGEAASMEFSSEGASLALVDRDADAVKATAARVEAAGGTAVALVGDVSAPADVDRYVAEALDAYGRIDALFNNAGVIGGSKPLVDQDIESFAHILAVNVHGPFLNMKAILPGMIERGSGAVVNTSSISGIRGYPMFSAYAASKHGVIGLTRAAASEVGQAGVRVNAICPGITNTPMWDDIGKDVNPDDPESVLDTYVVGVPLGRPCRPEEQARIAVFLASDRASYINGEYILADGGMIFSGA